MKKIKVLQANKLYYPVTGGIEKVVQDISEGFRDDPEIENQVLVCQKKGRGSKDIVNGVSVTRCSSWGVVSSLPISFSYLKEFKIWAKCEDIIHIHAPFPLGDLACRLSNYKGKIVVWWHSDIVRQKKLMKAYRPLMEWLLKRADAIIVATEGNIEGSQYLVSYREKCHVIPFGVDPKLMFEADRYLKSERIKKLEAVDIKFLFTGRLVCYKGCDVLLQAFAKMKNKKATLTIIGEGKLRAELVALSEKLEIKERVDFLGEVGRETLLQNFAECDVFVLPSVAPSEAFGIVQIEAMAYGKPVINTKLKSGVPYVSIHGETGVTVEAGDVKALSAAMDLLAENFELRERYGVAAAARAREIYSMDCMLARLKQLYINLVS